MSEEDYSLSQRFGYVYYVYVCYVMYVMFPQVAVRNQMRDVLQTVSR